MVKIRIRGINQVTRSLSYASDLTYQAARRGTVKAAKYLLQKILAKFGHYQSTGGPGGGPWPQLKFETIKKKLLKYGVGNKPLIASGQMSNSSNWTVVEGGTGRLAASVGTDDEKILNHIYGAPHAHIPQRDPCRVTAVEEMDKCRQIITDEVINALTKGGV